MGTGGMRYGAGRPGHRAKAEQLRRVDVREWARRGYLRGACSFSWSWNRGGEPSGSIGVAVHGPDALTLSYAFTADGGARHVAERLAIVSTACAYGGERPWFICPRCKIRVAVLFLRGGYFACRRCKRVAYSSQSEDILDRLWRKQRWIEAMLEENWRRPKGMRAATYRSLIAKLCDIEGRRDSLLCVFVQRLAEKGAF
jgi:hypothetical protein